MTVMHGAVFGEFLGTMVMLLFGNGVVANVVLDKSKGQNSGWIVITAGWGFAVFCGIVVSVGVGGVAHLNPAVTLASAIVSGDYSHVLPYVLAQMAGAIVSGLLVWLTYLPHWPVSDPDAKLAVFCTQPAIRNPFGNVMSEVIGTVMLIVIGMGLASKGVCRDGPGAGHGAVFLGHRGVGRSGSRSAGRPGMRSILRGTWGRGLRTGCCRSRASAILTGAMPGCRCWGRWLARQLAR